MPKRSTLRNKADRAFSFLVRARGYCEAEDYNHVRHGGQLQCAHIIGRRYYSVRWDEDNALCLCAGHHIWFTHNPEEWRAFIDERWPGRYAKLLRRARKPWDKDYDRVLARLDARTGIRTS